MKTETLQGVTLPKIGFGTWRIGGGSSPDPSDDDRSMAALRSALDLGYTHFDTAEYYAAGHSEELLGAALRQSHKPRESVFITTKVSPEHLTFEGVQLSCEASLRRLGMDYIDLYLIHWPSYVIKLSESFRGLNKLVAEGKVKHLGVSNFSLKLLKQSIELCETPLLTDQVSYSLPDRTYEKNGVLEYCQANGIFLTAYSPVKRRYISGNKTLRAIAQERGVSTEQIALAWLVRQPCVITIPMSMDPAHQAENLAAADLELTESELSQLG